MLKALILKDKNYEVSYQGSTIEFNICDNLNINDTTSNCYGAFACFKNADGTTFKLSGNDFKSSIEGEYEPKLEGSRINDTDKGGLTLQFTGGNQVCADDSTKNYTMNLQLICPSDSDTFAL